MNVCVFATLVHQSDAPLLLDSNMLLASFQNALKNEAKMSFLNPLKQLSTGKAALWLRYIRDFDGILNPSQLAMLHQGTSSQSSIKGQLSIKQRIGGRQISAFLSPPDFGGKLTRMSQSARQVLGNALQSSLEQQRAKESLEKMTIFTVTSHENTGLLAPFLFPKKQGI